jgi:hypothetical protein
MIKSSWFMRFYTSAAAVVLALIFVSKGPVWLKMRTVHGAVAQPFYLERAFYERDQAGALSMYSRDVFARSNDGRTALVEDEALDKLPPGVKLPPTRKVTMIDGFSVWLIDSLRLKTSWPKMTSTEARNELALMANHEPDCGFDQAHIIGRESVGGQKTFITVSDVDLVRQSTVWYAPELGCQALQSKTTLKGDGTVLVEGRLIKAFVGEPDARLFDLGDNYRDVSATDLIAGRLQAIGWKMNSEIRRMAASQDRERKQVIRGEPTPKEP